jgi:hypothetical protein
MYVTSAVVLLAVALVSCNDDPPTTPSQGFVVTGTIQNRKGDPIPPNSRILGVWDVPMGADYIYFFGEGSLDPVAGTFRIRFDAPPPSDAMGGVLGVGYIVATTDQSLKNGDRITDGSAPLGTFGLSERHAVIYVQTHDPQFVEWVTAFSIGYNLGVGVQGSGSFEEFDPTSPSSAVLVLDDAENLTGVNWH